MNIFLKILAYLFTGLFAYAAIVQYNDPDATKWYFIYGVAALASLLFALNKLKAYWAIVLSVFYLVLAIYTWPEKFEGVSIGEGDIVNIESGREALGLLIAAIMMGIYALVLKKKAS